MNRRLSEYTRTRIINLKRDGSSFNSIQRTLLREDKLKCSRQAISAFWKKYLDTGEIKPRHGGGRPSHLNAEHLSFLDAKMTENNELNGKELKDMLEEQFGIRISKATVLRWRRHLGWKYAPTRYCQMVSQANKEKRLLFAQACLDNGEEFGDVIFTDETKIQMGCNTKKQCYKKGEGLKTRLRPRAKHPYQVNVQFFFFFFSHCSLGQALP